MAEYNHIPSRHGQFRKHNRYSTQWVYLSRRHGVYLVSSNSNLLYALVTVVLYVWSCLVRSWHDDVIKWKHFPRVIKWKHFLRYWPFARGIHRSPVNFPHKGQWCGVNNREAGDLRRHHAHYDVTVMKWRGCILSFKGYDCNDFFSYCMASYEL